MIRFTIEDYKADRHEWNAWVNTSDLEGLFELWCWERSGQMWGMFYVVPVEMIGDEPVTNFRRLTHDELRHFPWVAWWRWRLSPR